MKQHTVAGGSGIDIHVDETGSPGGRPILFVHGYSQSRHAWANQMNSDLAEEFRLLAMDNRGHGLSDKPRDAYGDSSLWAEDVRAVIETLDLDDPVLVGWSYGGLVISDYLGEYGDDDLGGINLVGAISKLGTDEATAVIGEAFLELVPGFESTDTAESVEAVRSLVERCVAGGIDEEDLYFALGYNVVVPPYVREGLHSREVVHDEDLAAVDVPVLVTHGEEDVVVLPDAAEDHARRIPTAETSYYGGVGHSPFWEAPDRFNEELREFVAGL
ncbi:alpha/beta fold hydrolase [Halomarina litorea]|uniref:alpha/beta fold hydrolase n=1 Tax=Halomarina litorea TaxID=2961595 RepID=UPI0020C4B33C|nr:alpha/beta hydrolase [Halomarina sp. BCD28]